MKKHMILLSVLVLSFITMFSVTSSNASAATLEKAKCTMTIEKTNTQDNMATASEPCKGQEFGYYVAGNDSYNIIGARNATVTKNGEVFQMYIISDKYVEADLTVYTGTQNTDDSETENDLPTLFKLRVIKDNSAVHTSNSGSSKTYKHLNLNDIVEVVEKKGTWYKIKDGTTYGWIWNQYVSTDLTPEVPLKVLYELRVTKDKAAVHTSNSGKSKTYKHLYTNNIVEVVEKKGTWYRIKDGTDYGWIWNQYVSTNLTPQTMYELRIGKDKAAIHTSNSGKSKTYKHLYKNNIVEVVEKKGTWYKIKDGSNYGWVWNQYVSTDLTQKTLYKMKVTKDKAAVHTSDSGKAKTYKHLSKNNVVEVVEKKNNWYKIKDGKSLGWIYGNYVKK
ncbi:SH3 domain-containing protein [Bacillales bacterium AN1005]